MYYRCLGGSDWLKDSLSEARERRDGMAEAAHEIEVVDGLRRASLGFLFDARPRCGRALPRHFMRIARLD